jgi:hypothetical protein
MNESVHVLLDAGLIFEEIMKSSANMKEAAERIMGLQNTKFMDININPQTLTVRRNEKEIRELTDFLDLDDEIRKLSKSTYNLLYGEDKPDEMSKPEVIFRYEICYSYACKLLSRVHPCVFQFSCNPTKAQVVDAEISVCMAASESKLCKRKREEL